MRAKEISTEWYFDIINPVLAEICRKNKIAVYTFGNMVHSKGNMPYSMGNNYVREPRIMEACSGKEPAMPKGGSIARWFVEMGRCAKILNPKAAQAILDLAEQIDDYTYFYEIEQVHIDPFAPNSFIAIEKRLWNEARQYGLTETEYQVPSAETYPLCERLHEGVGVRKPTDISWCEFEVEMSSPYGADDLRKMICEKTGTAISVAQKCKIPTITSDNLQLPISGTAFSITAISGKEKTAVTEYIKRHGGKVATEYSPKTTVFVAKQQDEAKFVEENSANKNFITKLVNNSLLNGTARKMLGENIFIVRYEDFFIEDEKKDSVEEVSAQEYTFNEHGDLVMTMAQAEAVWTVKTGKGGHVISGYTGNEEILNVPAYIDGMPVVTVNKGKKNASVRTIVIPTTVKKINAGAFPGYSALAEIVFNSSDTSVGTAAFSGCPLMFDENNCFVANGVLQDCNQSGDVVISGKAKKIPDSFVSKSSIQRIDNLVIQEGVDEIGWGAFESCKVLKTVSLPNSIKRIRNGAYMSCTALENVTIGDAIEEICCCAFDNCSNLKKLTLGKSLKKIETSAFSFCIELSDIYYNDTKSRWYSINKEFGWDRGAGHYTVHCIDGDIDRN